ncbi:MAG TPA: 3-hydroxyacyl-CoA dehydrogenase NAD-binding domain-containing protein [Magnetospirillaceae bacterium]|nr:3-hydroxyacyl-CoA dehydrogenase NAD-binding domain-containing protein [Magnetospirillaceae bacterium]
MSVKIAEIDNPPVNALSAEVRLRLRDAIRDPEAEAIVVIGAGKTFIGGADIREFDQPPVEPSLPDLLLELENLDKPVVAALNGAALGGGLETALAAHYRIASPTATFACPEVKLGLIPGAGGTQRMPRLIGLSAASDLIASGRTINAQEALELGLIDRIEEGDLRAAAIAQAQSMIGKVPVRTGDLAVQPGPLASIKARGRIAPVEALRLVSLAAEMPLAEGLAEERATFLKLKQSPQSAALRHVFFAERASGKIEGTPHELKTIGVVGTGLMGAGIASAALKAGYRVIAVDQTEEMAAKGKERIEKLLKAPASVSHSLDDLAEADLVIEAVFDDLEVKTELFKKLDCIVRPEAILATNTSYLDPDRIAAATAHPERVIGLHFFSPAHVMRLVEVVRCRRASSDVLATGIAFARKLGKLPVVCGVTEGFIGNRMFSAYRNETEALLMEGARPEQIDKAMEEYGFAMGPFAVFDLAGLEIAWARRKRQNAPRVIADQLCEAGRFGQKAGRGWYLYEDGQRREDPDVTAMIEAARKGTRTIPSDEIVSRLLSALRREGQKLLAEQIAARASDIDLVMIHGYGFPAYKGGPMFSAEQAP